MLMLLAGTSSLGVVESSGFRLAWTSCIGNGLKSSPIMRKFVLTLGKPVAVMLSGSGISFSRNVIPGLKASSQRLTSAIDFGFSRVVAGAVEVDAARLVAIKLILIWRASYLTMFGQCSYVMFYVMFAFKLVAEDLFWSEERHFVATVGEGLAA